MLKSDVLRKKSEVSERCVLGCMRFQCKEYSMNAIRILLHACLLHSCKQSCLENCVRQQLGYFSFYVVGGGPQPPQCQTKTFAPRSLPATLAMVEPTPCDQSMMLALARQLAEARLW